MHSRYLRLGVWLAGAAALAAAAWFAWQAKREGFDSRLFWSSFGRANLGWLAATAVLMMLSYYGRALRWAVMLEPLRPHPSHWNLFKATVIGFTAVVLLGRPGELVRPYLIATSERVPFPSQIAAWLLERVYDILMVVGLFGFALAHISTHGGDAPPAARWAMLVGGWVAGGSAVLCLAVLFALHRWSGDLKERIASSLGFLSAHHQERLAQKIGALVEGLHATRRLSSVARLFAWSAVEWGVIVAGYAAFLRAFPETSALGIADLLVYVGFVSFGSIIQIPGVGGGIQVVSAVVLVEFYGVGLEAAAGISLLVWVVAMLLIVPIGLTIGVADGWRLARLRTLAKEIET